MCEQIFLFDCIYKYMLTYYILVIYCFCILNEEEELLRREMSECLFFVLFFIFIFLILDIKELSSDLKKKKKNEKPRMCIKCYIYKMACFLLIPPLGHSTCFLPTLHSLAVSTYVAKCLSVRIRY